MSSDSELSKFVFKPTDDFDLERHIVKHFIYYMSTRNCYIKQGDKLLSADEIKNIIDDFIAQCVKH